MPNQPQNVGSCEGCRHAQPVVTESEHIILECYRYPPQVLIASDGTVFQVHPDAVYRCGEYRKTAEGMLDDMLHDLREHRKNREEIRKIGEGHE